MFCVQNITHFYLPLLEFCPHLSSRLSQKPGFQFIHYYIMLANQLSFLPHFLLMCQGHVRYLPYFKQSSPHLCDTILAQPSAHFQGWSKGVSTKIWAGFLSSFGEIIHVRTHVHSTQENGDTYWWSDIVTKNNFLEIYKLWGHVFEKENT